MSEGSAAAGPLSDETQILQADRNQNNWMIEADADALDALLAPDFVLVHMTGLVQHKTEWLEEIRSGTMAYHDIRPQSASVEIDESTALLVTRNVVAATIWATNAIWRLEMTTTFARISGHWRPTHSQARTY